MPGISVKDQIKKLVELQKVDGEIYNLKRDLEEKPVLIENLKQQFEQEKGHLKNLENQLKDIQLKRKEKELELKVKEEEIAKANIQLSQLKTNKEYTAKLTEIENIKVDKSIIEEKILLSFDESDGASGAIDKEKAKVAQSEKDFLMLKKQLEDDIKFIQDRLHVLEGQRSQFLPDIDKSSFMRYEKTLQHKNGLAIVPVVKSSCGGCFMNVPAQTINAIKMHDQFIYCEMCTRILYLEDDL